MSRLGHSLKSAAPAWSPRVRREKVSRLYLNDAAGVVDNDLIEEFGAKLFWRCRSILIVGEAAAGRVPCPACEPTIECKGDLKDQTIRCGGCRWSTRWADYQKTYPHQLYAYGIASAADAFMKRRPQADPPREKMLLIDRLIHVWHWESSRVHEIGRPAAVNLIEGSRRQVLELLDQLGGGPLPAGGVR